MKKGYALFLFCAFHFSSFGGNVAGGEVSYRCISGNTIEFTLTMWGDNFSPNDTFTFSFGDNTNSVYTNQSAISFTNLAPIYPNYSEIQWTFVHNYPGPGSYSIVVAYTNRNSGITNIPNAPATILTLFSDIVIDPNIGCNSSPVFTNNNLIELLSISTSFNSNLGATDPDGDSLSYLLIPCSDTNGFIAGYTFPNIVGGGNFGVDAITGDYYWSAPQTMGRYNFVIAIEQWKLFPNNQRYLIATTSREIQLYVGTPSAVSEQNLLLFFCYPNVISQGETFHFQFEKEGNYQFKIVNIEGKPVFSNYVFCQKEHSLNFPTLAPGIYFLNVRNEDLFESSQKIILKSP